MPPKVKISREMILEAGIRLLRQEGADSLNVRRLASELGCSTQPIMYSFPNVESLKTELYRAVDAIHSEYIMQMNNEDPMMAIGLNYIRFAYEEKNLFRFLFQSDKVGCESVKTLIETDELDEVYAILQQEAELTEEQAREAFSALFAAVHGFASLLANNSLEYDEIYFTRVLTEVFYGVIGVMKGGTL